MNTRNVILFIVFAAAMALLSSSCVKIQNKVILKGDWELVYYKLDTIESNYMEVVLPGYDNPPGCCKYMIDFQDNDVAIGSYYINDTLDYTVQGTWSLDEKSKLYINLDKYVNGTFDVDRQSRTKYQLSTDVNIIEFSPGFFIEYPLVMDIRRRD